MDGLSILRIEAKDTSPTVEGETVKIGALWVGSAPGASGVRLFDAEASTVEEPASEQKPIYSHGIFEVEQEEATAIYVVFGKQEAESTNVVLPFGGVFTDVSIVDESESTLALRTALNVLVPDSIVVTSNVSDFSAFSVSLLKDIETRNSGDEVVMNLTADVLFSLDKA